MTPAAVQAASGRFWRWPAAAVLAAAVTCALFWMMHYLIAAEDGFAFDRLQPPLSLDFVRVERDSSLVRKERFIPPKPRVEKPQERPPVPVEPLPRLSAPRLEAPSYVPAITGTFDAVGFSRTREIAPLARVSPVYPPSAERRGIEGWVRVEFTITEDGGVVDTRVIEADPPGVFDRAALRAVSKWRYQPQVIEGQVIRRSGVEVTIEFRLE